MPPFLPVEAAERPFHVGVDVGGTNIKLGVVDDLGRVVARYRVPTQTELGPEEGARRMGELMLRAIAELGLTHADIGGVGLGTPGTMDIPAGMLLVPHNLPGWENFPIRDRLSHYCGFPVVFTNDAGAAAFGEFWVGSGVSFHSMILLTLGTGVGGGIIIGDMALDGEHSHGSECGHIIIDMDADARVCPCGQPGHLEAYASATGVIARAEEALAAGVETSVRTRLEAGEKLSPLLLGQEAERGDAFSLEIILETARYLGIGIVSLLHVIDPDGVLLGGAMTFGGHQRELGRRFLARVREEVRARAFPVLAEKVVVEYATLGSDAGFIGAAGIARVKSRQRLAAHERIRTSAQGPSQA